MMEYTALSPGEALYIPPGYMVATEATSASVFLDILSPSKEQILLTEAILTPVPMRKMTVNGKAIDESSLTSDDRIIITQVRYIAIYDI